MKIKVFYIVSDINKALAFEWIALNLDRSRFDLTFILLNSHSTQLEKFLILNSIPVYTIPVNGKKDYVKAFLKIRSILKINAPDAIHCHMRKAEMLGITAAFFAGVKNRIFTRHYATFNHVYFPKGVWIDKIINRFSTKIVAISQNVKDVLTGMEHVPEKKISLIHHGFDLSYFNQKKDCSALKKQHSIPGGKKYIGIISRYLLLKGFEYSIPAIGKFMNENPDWHLVIANATGGDSRTVKELLKKHMPDNSYTEIIFEEDLSLLYNLFDIYIHTPIDEKIEAFGQTYVEALASGVPSIFTLSGVAREFIVHDENALVVDFKNSTQIQQALERLKTDESLRQRLSKAGKASVQIFSLNTFIKRLELLYAQS